MKEGRLAQENCFPNTDAHSPYFFCLQPRHHDHSISNPHKHRKHPRHNPGYTFTGPHQHRNPNRYFPCSHFHGPPQQYPDTGSLQYGAADRNSGCSKLYG